MTPSKARKTHSTPAPDESLTARRVGHAHQVLADLTSVTTVRGVRRVKVDVLLDRIRDFQGGFSPTASGRPGDTGGPSTVLVCTVHADEDLVDCQRAGRVGCVGEPVEVPADPTGDAVVSAMVSGSRDRAREDEAELQATVIELLAAARKLDRLAATYEPAAVGSKVRREAGEGPAGCEWCRTVGAFEEVHTSSRFEKVWSQALAVPVKVCSSCYRFARDHRRRPTNEELRFRHGRGQGRWPAKRVTPKRRAS